MKDRLIQTPRIIKVIVTEEEVPILKMPCEYPKYPDVTPREVRLKTANEEFDKKPEYFIKRHDKKIRESYQYHILMEQKFVFEKLQRKVCIEAMIEEASCTDDWKMKDYHERCRDYTDEKMRIDRINKSRGEKLVFDETTEKVEIENPEYTSLLSSIEHRKKHLKLLSDNMQIITKEIKQFDSERLTKKLNYEKKQQTKIDREFQQEMNTFAARMSLKASISQKERKERMEDFYTVNKVVRSERKVIIKKWKGGSKRLTDMVPFCVAESLYDFTFCSKHVCPYFAALESILIENRVLRGHVKAKKNLHRLKDPSIMLKFKAVNDKAYLIKKARMPFCTVGYSVSKLRSYQIDSNDLEWSEDDDFEGKGDWED
jgi:hypothetical protein